MKLLLLLLVPFTFMSCNKEEYTQAPEANVEQAQAAEDVSAEAANADLLFVNVERYTEASGNSTITGEIHSTKKTTCTMTFAYRGSEGAIYEAYVCAPYYILRPNNGPDRRTIDVVLEPGVNKFSVAVLFSGANQSADARLVINYANGLKSDAKTGYVDLAVSGRSNY